MKTWGQIQAETMSPERITRSKARAREELIALSLRQIREDAGKTQEEMAALMDVTQSALSKLERRTDNPIEALRKYVDALGGELELVAVVGNKRVKLLGV